MVGREAELEDCARALASRGRQVVLIAGQAGVGKSRLAEDCLARAAREGWKVWRATATAAAATVPLGALAHLIPSGVDLSDPVRGFAKVVDELAGPRRDRRWVMLIDDLHLLDSASAVLLRQLLDANLVRLIATLRTGEPTSDTVDALCYGDSVLRIDLEAFNQEQVGTLLEAALGRPVDQHTLFELHSVSGGNVLYLRELVLGGLATGALTSDGEIWQLAEDRPVTTPKLAELIGARLAAAGERGATVLELLALTEPLPLTDAQAVASLDVVTDLEAAGLIRVVQDRHRTAVALAHPLYAETQRSQIPALRRRTLLLDQIERTQARGARRRDDALRLTTWQMAATGTADTAMLLQAARLARYARDYPQVVALLRAIPEDEYTPEAWLIRGESHYTLMQFAEADAAYARCQQHAESPEQQFGAVIRRIQALVTDGRPQDGLAVNRAALDSATDPLARDVLRLNEACLGVWAGMPFQTIEGLESVEQVPDSRMRLWGFGCKSIALESVGHGDTAAWLSEIAYEQQREEAAATVLQPPAWQLVFQSLACSAAGRLEQARSVAMRATLESTEEHVLIPRVWAALARGWANWLAGHIVDARHGFAEALALSRDHPSLATPFMASGLAASCALLGDPTAAEEALGRAHQAPITALYEPHAQLGRAWLLAARGQLAGARTVLGDAAHAARDTGLFSVEGVLLTDMSRLGGAVEVVDRLSELADVCEGPLALARAHLAAALVSRVPEKLLQAADELEQLGADLLAAEAAATAAEALRAAGRPRPSTAATARVEKLRASCQGARTPLLTTTESTMPLTAREKEIALLAVRGKSSKEMAELLTLSVRTVDNHLRSIYSKVGVSSRQELAKAFDVTQEQRSVL
ncbi:LuxR C-terminal-related transcriptional regulator [Streptomyces sp. NPDC056470]|uniref:helix-turn-helix transcriptional regulator n=1 Tax=Streptomyces sp. NPDC056470 TaxID=3345831 RepID=UPI00369AD3A6